MNKHLRRFLRATSGPSSSYIQSGVTIVVTMLIQTVAAIWWLAKLDLRVHMHDKFVEQNQGLIEIFYRLEERVKNLTEEVNELEAIHKHK